MTDHNDHSDREFIYKLAAESLAEQRARRRWGIFFKLLLVAYIVFVTALYYQQGVKSGGRYDPHAAIISISGVIGANGPNSSETINSVLRSAFEEENSVGVILEINSPGGSAVEANRIYNEIRRLREKYPDKPIIAVAGDYCASGGYYIAAAADHIYADPGSIVGSIGVIYSSFGFVEAMEKFGIERRVLTAGSNKNLNDPFSPQLEEGQQVIDELLSDIHAVFIEAVKNGRGERLVQDSRVFNGAFFSGSDSVELGLVDGLGDIGSVTRDILEVEEVLYYQKSDWFDSVVGRFVNAVLTQAGGVRAAY